MFHSVEDSVLVNQYLAGDQKSLEILISRYKQYIFRTIVSKVKSVELAEDLFQDTFFKIINTLHAGKYNEEGKFLPWAMRIANNLIIDYFRKTAGKYMVSESSSSDECYNVFTHMSCDSESWVDSVMRTELEAQLVETVKLLPTQQRELIQMRIFQGLSFKEIAEQKGISINTALGRMRYAMQNMRRIIDEKQLVLEY
ncbi:MAG: sigma-70 family RNA polymerase sigma factor [Crocinitomicaceae bacterium]|jgi:RNA polymerase sigma-70 factor (ECF subfamily)|nr:sigma-70 family RNA polymerase sigma factor [Crocinitomicaceae bacterium]